MGQTVLVAGGTGLLGRHVVRELAARGHAVRVLARDPSRARALAPGAEVVRGDALDPAGLRGACEGADAVFSCVGASVQLGLRGWRGYTAVDAPANANLIAAAREAGVRRFVYVSLFGADKLAGLDYAAGHERVVDALRASGLSHTVVRPTGFFSALRPYLDMARAGRGVVFGDGAARSNPVDDRDLAAACAEALFEGPAELPVGGPEVLTRRAMLEAAFRAVGRAPALWHVPPAFVRAAGWCLRPLHPRLSHLMAFVAAVTQADFVAPARGARTLEAYYREAAAGG
jgi:uncharacterized protein YbjT (DUF2867 family)